MLGATTVRYMLDTNICIYVINARPPEVLDRFLVHEAEGLGISAITASELYWGASKSGSARNLALLSNSISPLTVFDYDLAAARRYGELRAQLEKRASPSAPWTSRLPHTRWHLASRW